MPPAPLFLSVFLHLLPYLVVLWQVYFPGDISTLLSILGITRHDKDIWAEKPYGERPCKHLQPGPLKWEYAYEKLLSAIFELSLDESYECSQNKWLITGLHPEVCIYFFHRVKQHY